MLPENQRKSDIVISVSAFTAVPLGGNLLPLLMVLPTLEMLTLKW